MINIIKSVLFDCGYEDVVQTEIEFEKLEYKIDIFKNEDVGSQVFIVLQTLESQLVSLSSIKDFIIEIANFFRESDIYLPDMDKNTSLVFCVKNDIFSIPQPAIICLFLTNSSYPSWASRSCRINK